MSWKILVYRAKPNPTGKDKTSGGVPKPEQLLGEWVDLQNIGDASVTLSTLNLCHTEFGQNCVPTTKAKAYWTGKNSEVLAPKQIVRVHTGRSTDSSRMADEDKRGVDFHSYAEKGNFVLNNKCGDRISVRWKTVGGEEREDDAASYDPKPPEGAVLKRVDYKLIP